VTSFTQKCAALFASLLILHAVPAHPQKDDISPITLNDCWRFPLNSALASAPSSDADNLYLGLAGGRVAAVSLATGLQAWSTEIGGEIVSNVLSHGNNILVATNVAGRRSVLRSLSKLSGLPNREIEIVFGDNIRMGVSAGKLVLVYGSGEMAAYDVASERAGWRASLPRTDVSTVVFTDRSIIAATSDGKIRSVSAADGKIEVIATTEHPVTTLGLVEEDLLWGEDRGSLIRFDAEGKFVSWKYKNGARIANAISTERGVIATSYDNFVYLLSGYNGDIRWKKRMAGRIAGIAIDGDIGVVLTVGDPIAVLVNLDSGKQAGQFTIGEGDGYSQPPIVVGGKIVFITGTRVLAESIRPCAAK
jgi:outer membrane protein assembly factor BamB